MYNIPLFKAEKEVEGLAEKVQAGLSIAWHSQLEKWEKPARSEYSITNKVVEEKLGKKVFASEYDSDLYITKSILVTTSWNKNDDVFDKAEVWAARHTPEDKPTNLNHDENLIVGHITGNWAIDADNKILSEDATIEDLPDVFHLVNSAVIYKHWESNDLKERTIKLIAEIEEGTKFVSMECLFRSFDYALIYPDASKKILARKEDTAFLTKHLRAYGGEGVYDGIKVGRLLKGITFSGKGYVDKPANPNSIIFNTADICDFGKASIVEKNDVFNKEGVITSRTKSMENKIMAEQADLQKELDTYKSQLAEANTKLANINKEQYDKQIADLNSKVEASTQSYTELKANFDKITSELEAANKVKAEVEAAKVELETKLAEVKANEIKTNRIATLVAGGIDAETAKSKVEKFASLNDEMFKDVSDALIAGVTASAAKPVEKKEEGKKEEVDATAALQNAEVEKTPALTAASEKEDDAMAKVREQLLKVVASQLGTTKKKVK